MEAQIDPETAKVEADYVLENDKDLNALESNFNLMLKELNLLKA